MKQIVQLVLDNLTPLIVNLISNIFMACFMMWAIKWPAQRKRRWLIVLGAAICIVIISAVVLGITLDMSTIKSARGDFSHLNECKPQNNDGVHWGVFNDNPFNGNSNVSIETLHYPNDKNDCYAAISYSLGEKSDINSYCGVFSGFASQLGEPRDVSRFNGIRLSVWREGNMPEGVQVYLQISTNRLLGHPNHYHQRDITNHVMAHGVASYTKTDVNRSNISIPFSEFVQPPDVPGIKVEFDKTLQKEVYQIAIIIKGEKGGKSQGKIGFDDMAFFR